MASTMRFDNWQTTDGTSIATTNASGDITFAGAVAGAGKILQVVSAQTNTAFSTTSTSYVDVTGLSVSITPTSTSSTILLMFAANVSAQSANQLIDFQFDRNSTAIPGGGTYASMINAQFTANVVYEILNASINYMDSPSTTSTLTYKVQVKTSSGTVYLFRRNDVATVTSYGSLLAMEVSA